MFDAARMGNAEVLLAAIEAGLPVNLTNDKGFLIIAAPRPRVINSNNLQGTPS
jgi:hypothetical protein